MPELSHFTGLPIFGEHSLKPQIPVDSFQTRRFSSLQWVAGSHHTEPAAWEAALVWVVSHLPSSRSESTLVVRCRGLSISAYFASRDPVSGTVYYVMLGVFAIMALLVARR